MDEIEQRLREFQDAVEQRVRRRTRVLALVATLAVVVGLAPMVVLAATFIDVGSGNPFATEIDWVSDAGIASGCGNGRYCPATAVTREQMAAFLSRTGGRVGFAYFNSTPISAVGTELASVTITPGNVAGGTVFLRVSATYAVNTAATTGFPYLASATLFLDDGFLWDTGSVLEASTGGFQYQSGALEYVVSVPTGVPATVSLVGKQNDGDDPLSMWGTLTVEYIPFSESGDDTFGPAGGLGGVSIATPAPNTVAP